MELALTGDGVLTLTYPPEQLWGALFITAGKPVPSGNRPSIDLSRFPLTHVLKLMANVIAWISKIKHNPTMQRSTVSLPLDAFANVDLTHLYVVLEVVFLGLSGETVGLATFVTCLLACF